MGFRFRFVRSCSGSWFWVPGSRPRSRAAQPPSPAGSPSHERSRASACSSFPLKTPREKPRIYWIGEASAVLLADDLNALRQARVHARRTSRCFPAAAGAARRHVESRHGHPAGTGGRRDARRHRLVPADRWNDFGARPEHPARHRPDGARIRRSRTARRSVCDFRARQPAPRGPVGVRRSAAAAGAAGVRELRQRAHRDVDAGENRLSRSGDQARSRVRSRAARAVERAS